MHRNCTAVKVTARTDRANQKVTGIDIYFGSPSDDGDEVDDHSEEEESDEEDEQDESSEEDDDVDKGAVQEWVRHRWNLNASFRGSRTLRPESFDLINSRMLMDGIDATRWSSYTRELQNVLKPNGWVQMVEIELRFQSDSGVAALDGTNPLFRWQQLYYSAMEQMGKNPRVGSSLGRLLTQAGFQDVDHQTRQLRIGRWNSSELSKQVTLIQGILADQILSIGSSRSGDQRACAEAYRSCLALAIDRANTSANDTSRVSDFDTTSQTCTPGRSRFHC